MHAAVQVSGDVELGPGTVNLFATQFSIDRNHRSVISFPGATMHVTISSSVPGAVSPAAAAPGFGTQKLKLKGTFALHSSKLKLILTRFV